jgi:hypothetical protein
MTSLSRIRVRLILGIVRRWFGRADAGRALRSAGHGTQRSPWSGRAATRRYKYQALVRLLPGQAEDPEAAPPGPTYRAVVRARHHDSHRSKLFSALVTSEDGPLPGQANVVTVVVVGDDADDYLAPGEHFALLRGCDVARGTVTRRIFV